MTHYVVTVHNQPCVPLQSGYLCKLLLIGLLVEPFSGVEIHMEMDMEWKWSGNGAQFVKIVWIGLDLGAECRLKTI